MVGFWLVGNRSEFWRECTRKVLSIANRYTSSGQTSWQVKEDSLQHSCETKSEVKVVLKASLHVLELELERVQKVRVASASPADRVSLSFCY